MTKQKEEAMSQNELNEAVARVTGESVSLIRDHGFSIADPLDVNFDPEPRRPMTFDWDTMSASEWPQ
jgi:hypothetical protein